jgi:hypothetical protein
MNILKMLAANPPATGNQTLYQVINGLGLTTNLKLCLDAGDSASYDPGTQRVRWLDTSGLGYDFFRGSSTGGDAAEPTFNGSAGGLSSSEYWSFDGADYFLYDTTNEAWMENIHKDNAKFTFLSVIDFQTSAASQVICSNRGATLGYNFVVNASGALQFIVFDGASATVLSVTSTATVPSGWCVVGITLDETAGTGTFIINGTTESFTSTYTTPSAASASTMRLGMRPTGVIPIASGGLMAEFAAWEALALSSANLTSLYNGIKGRFGL